jgi:antitoxin YefM
MKTLSLSEAKMKLSALIDSLGVTDEEVLITKNGRPAAVLVSPDEFESLRETLSIRSDNELMEEIKSGLKAIKEKIHRYIRLMSCLNRSGFKTSPRAQSLCYTVTLNPRNIPDMPAVGLHSLP